MKLVQPFSIKEIKKPKAESNLAPGDVFAQGLRCTPIPTHWASLISLR